jgi:hypothetical protein
MRLTGHARYYARALIRLIPMAVFTAAIHTSPALAATKIALSGSAVTASANDGNVPSNTVDGNLSTRWSAQGSGVWIQYNLGSCQAIDYARIAWSEGNTRKATFSVSVSKDGGATWAQVLGNTQSSGTTTSFETVQLPDPAANMVRIYGYGNTSTDSSTWTSITELELYTLGASTACGTSGGTSAKLSIPASNVTASADDGNVPSNTVDGSLATRWSAQGSGVWIQYKLGSCQTIDYARLAWYQGDTRKTTFSVSVSKDSGSTWTQILGNTQSSGTTTAFETVQLPDTAANMVRIFGYGNTSSAWTSLSEMELYSAGASTGCSASTSTANYPADIFAGLKPWKLTLPLSASGGTGQTLGVGGVATPSGATLTTSDTTSQLNITSGGTSTSPRVYDGQGHTVGRINITASYVVVQNFRINAGSQYGAFIDASNVTFQNNDIKGVKVSGDGDLNAITAFGNNITIQFNTAINYVSGDPGSSHTDFIQTWVSSSHPTASANWKIIGNKAVGPSNPSRVNSIASIHQCIMAEGLGRGGNSGGSGDPHDWVISDNECGDSWNQSIKLDGVDNVAITRNNFTGSSDKIFDISSASSNVKVYSDNIFGSGYGLVGYTVTSGAGPGTAPSGSGGAQFPALEVKQPALATYTSTYFKLNANKDGVLLTSLFGGATTSSNTAYARSELREMQSDGTTNAAWSCSSGARKMHIRQRIVKTPIHKPEMVVGQIHDDSNDVLTIHFTGPEDSSGVGTGNGVGTGVMRVHWNNDTSQDVVDSAYAVGDMMVVDIETISNTARVTYRNERTGVTTTIVKAFSGIVGSCYFKAGNYHQGCSKTNIYGGTNQSCVDKGWVSTKYETDPLGTSVLEMFELTMPY